MAKARKMPQKARLLSKKFPSGVGMNMSLFMTAAGSATNVEARTLADPGLKRFVEANLKGRLEPWPLESWDLPKLALAASYFRSYLENAAVWQARANVRRTYFTTWRRNVTSKC